MDFSFQTLVRRHASQMDAAFRRLVDTILRSSDFNITLLRISNVTEDSFHVTFEARMTNTGSVRASINPMTVELCGPSGHFGNLSLPAVTTRAEGTDIFVTSQLVKIVNKNALSAFIQAMVQLGATLILRNGQTSITAVGIRPREMVFEKEIPLRGWEGPLVSVLVASLVTNPLRGSPSIATLGAPRSATSTSDAGSSVISVTFLMANPSPLEMSLGTCSFDIHDLEGRVLAELKGRLDVRRNLFETTFRGHANTAIAAGLADDIRKAASERGSTSAMSDPNSPMARFVGKRCVGAGWCDDAVKGIDVPLHNVRRILHALGVDDAVPGPERRDIFANWSDRLLR
ncbi:hypothetical protein F5Y12DRAFT_782882 [Xylaria sp. FL1777]|nr:hypothetical protein F5Y12DRAFT_782882 [Xylaria sp. FL1777]